LPQLPFPKLQAFNPQVQTVPSDFNAIVSRAPPQIDTTLAGEAVTAPPPWATPTQLMTGLVQLGRNNQIV